MILHAGVSILSRLSLLQHWLASCTALMKHGVAGKDGEMSASLMPPSLMPPSLMPPAGHWSCSGLLLFWSDAVLVLQWYWLRAKLT